MLPVHQHPHRLALLSLALLANLLSAAKSASPVAQSAQRAALVWSDSAWVPIVSAPEVRPSVGANERQADQQDPMRVAESAPSPLAGQAQLGPKCSTGAQGDPAPAASAWEGRSRPRRRSAAYGDPSEAPAVEDSEDSDNEHEDDVESSEANAGHQSSQPEVNPADSRSSRPAHELDRSASQQSDKRKRNQADSGEAESFQDAEAAERREQEAAEASEAEAADRTALDEQQQQQREIILAQAQNEARVIKEQQAALLRQQAMQMQIMLRQQRELAANDTDSREMSSLADRHKLKRQHQRQQNLNYPSYSSQNQSYKDYQKHSSQRSDRQTQRQRTSDQQNSRAQQHTRPANDENLQASQLRASKYRQGQSNQHQHQHQFQQPFRANQLNQMEEQEAQLDIQFSDQPDQQKHKLEQSQPQSQMQSASQPSLAHADWSSMVKGPPGELKSPESAQSEIVSLKDLLAGAQHHYGSHYSSLHGHQKDYYQFAESHKKGQFHSGFKRGGKHFQISGHSSQHKGHADGHVKWHSKKGKGTQYWELKHKDKKKHHHHYAR